MPPSAAGPRQGPPVGEGPCGGRRRRGGSRPAKKGTAMSDHRNDVCCARRAARRRRRRRSPQTNPSSSTQHARRHTTSEARACLCCRNGVGHTRPPAMIGRGPQRQESPTHPGSIPAEHAQFAGKENVLSEPVDSVRDGIVQLAWQG